MKSPRFWSRFRAMPGWQRRYRRAPVARWSFHGPPLHSVRRPRSRRSPTTRAALGKALRRRRPWVWWRSARTRCGRPKRINPGARYAAMERFFTASHTGVAGARHDDVDGVGSGESRRRSASRPGADRVRLAHALGPRHGGDRRPIRPLLSGKFNRLAFEPGQRVWSQLDSAPVRGRSSRPAARIPVPTGRATRLKAPVMLVAFPRSGAGPPIACPFADWADGPRACWAVAGQPATTWNTT